VATTPSARRWRSLIFPSMSQMGTSRASATNAIAKVRSSRAIFMVASV
jgi:uncharacterized protein YegP (UPF0339 family)